ncbi:MAG: hydrogenase maturation nickel metallochaperone HypA [Desulfovibrio sp.]|nr:hydrogenase maturation nickel metallochaperone HypA [Desulfovibrio sp.]
MHEASLAQGLLNTATKAVDDYNEKHPQSNVQRIAELKCELGLISCVEPRTLTACFELLAEGTVAEGARLIVDVAPLACRCTHCGHAFTLRQRNFVCPECGNENIHFNGGHGLTLMALHVASEDTEHE